MLLTNPIEEDAFERTNENEDEEKVCEKERARRRLLLEESSSSSAAKVAFAFLSPKSSSSSSSSSSSLGKTEEKNINRLKESSKRLAQWGKNYDNEKFAKKAKSIEKKIEKLEQEKTVTTEGETYKLALDSDSIRSKHILQISNQQIGYVEHSVFKPLFSIDGLYIKPGDRVAILGDNGVGKSTLIETLSYAYEHSKHSPHANSNNSHLSDSQRNSTYNIDGIAYSPQCKQEYMDQELEKINLEDSIFDAVKNNCPAIDDHSCKSQLIATGFLYKDFEKCVFV